MIRPRLRRLHLVFLLSACLIGVPEAVAQPTVTYLGSQFDVLDLSDIRSDGYWFANWNQSTLMTGAPIGENALNTLPSWLQQLNSTFDPDPATSTYSWEQDTVLGALVNFAESTGGNSAFNTLTLPDGTTGLSGQAVTTSEAGNTGQSSNLLSDLVLGPGTPKAFVLHVVVDNEDAATGTGTRRVKARLAGPGVLDDTEDDTGNDIDDIRNNIADVHSFLYEGVTDDQVMRIQLRTTNSPIDGNAENLLGAGMAGFIVRGVPEPGSCLLMVFAAAGLLTVRRRD